MTRIFFILFLFVLTFASGCSMSKKSKLSPEVLKNNGQTDSYEKDFGVVKEGENLKHSFLVLNDSDKVLKIKSVDSSCGCTVSEVDRKDVAPKESFTLNVEFKTKGYSGEVQQFVYLYTDNIENSLIRFIIKAKVVK